MQKSAKKLQQMKISKPSMSKALRKVSAKRQEMRFPLAPSVVPNSMTGKMQIDQAANFLRNHKADYMTALLVPEYAVNAKIPSYLPLPTVSAHMKTTVNFVTNTNGQAAILVDPNLIADSTNTLSLILINTDPNLNLNTGVSPLGFTAYSQNSKITAGTVGALRLVSASLVIYPECSNNTAQGYIAGGIFTQAASGLQPISVGATTTTVPSQYFTSSAIDQAMYFQKAQIGGQQGVRCIYLPFDPTFEAFVAVNTYRGNEFGLNLDRFYWSYYVTGAPSLCNMVLEIIWNVEIEPLPNTITQILATPRLEPLERDGLIASKITSHPELVSQASGNLTQTAQLVADTLLDPSENKTSWTDRTIKFISDNAATLGSVVRTVTGFFL
jgi:hypothetical protein